MSFYWEGLVLVQRPKVVHMLCSRWKHAREATPDDLETELAFFLRPCQCGITPQGKVHLLDYGAVSNLAPADGRHSATSGSLEARF